MGVSMIISMSVAGSMGPCQHDCGCTSVSV